MRKTTRKIKSTAKRVIKPPAQSVVLSLVACLLLIGAPALISTIDDSHSVDVLDPVNLEDKVTLLSTSNVTFKESIPEEANKNVLRQLDDESNFAFFSMENLQNGKHVTLFNLIKFDKSIFQSNNVKIVVSLEGSDVYRVALRSFADGGSSYLNHIFDEVSEGVYELDLSTIDSIRLSSHPLNPLLTFVFNDEVEFSGTLSVSYAVYTTDAVPYAEFIMGAVGVVLVIVALFATPWFGLGGVSIKSRPRRR